MIERELRRALDHGEFRLHFQSVVNPATGAMAGAEALLRWRHPTRGLLTPDTFLGPAERAGLLDPIGEWVVSEAIAQRATWPTGTFVSINLAPSELASAPDRDLVGHIERTCVASGVAPTDVWVEVTEQPITELAPTLATLRALGDLGVTVALDDFGSGCASLARLRELPFDVCKLDRSFVSAMRDRAGVEGVGSVVAMVRAFGMEVVVEGVETAEQHDQLNRLGVGLLQGFHLARPAPAASVRERFEIQATARQRELVTDLLPDDDRTRRIFGEMVAQLWRRGESSAVGRPSPATGVSSDAVLRDGGTPDLARDLRDLEARVAAGERFGAMVVHELRNPATVLKLALGALRDAQDDGSVGEARHLLDVAVESAETIERLAAELLLAAKLERQEFDLHRAPFDLSVTVAAVVERVRLTSGRDVRSVRSDAPIHAFGDEARERQVLTNLLDNAVDCSPPGSPVVVSCSLEPDQVVVRIADEGPGVDARDRQRLFEPFTQLGANRRSTGAGLGLHIVDQLVRAQGGTVWVEDHRGGGAVFCHTLPRVTAHLQDLLRPLTAPRSVA